MRLAPRALHGSETTRPFTFSGCRLSRLLRASNRCAGSTTGTATGRSYFGRAGGSLLRAGELHPPADRDHGSRPNNRFRVRRVGRISVSVIRREVGRCVVSLRADAFLPLSCVAADYAALIRPTSSTGRVEEYWQVGRQTQAGVPVARETRALDDIQGALGVRPNFRPYN